MSKTLRAAALAGAMVLLAGCGASATDDRKSGKGSSPDAYQDATLVTVFRNADNVPNVWEGCMGKHRYAGTLSSGDSGVNKASTIIRLREDDKLCGGEG